MHKYVTQKLATAPFYVDLVVTRNQFPLGIDNIRLDGTNILLHFVRKDGYEEEIPVLYFGLAEGSESQLSGNSSSSALTNNGTHKNDSVTSSIEGAPNAPFVKLRLAFANTAINRELFSQENVTDIILLLNCKAELPVYPL